MSLDCCVALPRGAMCLSEVCDCGINVSDAVCAGNLLVNRPYLTMQGKMGICF